MEPHWVDALENDLQQAMAEVIARWGKRRLPMIPSDQTLHRMAKAATAVYEAVVEASPRSAERRRSP